MMEDPRGDAVAGDMEDQVQAPPPALFLPPRDDSSSGGDDLLPTSPWNHGDEQRGVAARVGKQGELCTQCRREHSKCKGKRHRVEGGHVCQRCYNQRNKPGVEAREEVPAAAAPSTPVRQAKMYLHLTPEKEEGLRGTIKAAGFGKQGRSRSAPENARVILGVHALMQPTRSSSAVARLSFHAAVKTVAKVEMISPHGVRQTIKRFAEEEKLEPPEVKRMKLDDPRHMLFGETGPSLEVQRVAYECVEEAARENVYISLGTIRARIFAETSEDIPKSTMADWMGKMKLEYGEKKLSGLKAEYARALIRRYILEYSLLVEEASARRSKVVLVWMDESYIHAGYCSRFSWDHRTDDIVPNRVRGSNKGKRLIIMQALTRDGMLEQSDLSPSDSLEERCASAAIVTNKLSAEGFEPEDYHDTLNGEKFLAWMKNRLIPAFQAKYPGKKMVLILDNAKYHHARGKEWVTPSKMKKVAIGAYLRFVKVKSITVEEDDGSERVVPADKFTADVKRDGTGGPRKDQLVKVLSDYVKSHPAINTTLVEQLMKHHGHRLLYTPPYESWLQPIELVWANVKRQVAKQSHVDRKWQQTAEQTRAALSGLPPELCAKLVGHSEKLMNEWLHSRDAGSLRQHGSIQALGRLSEAERRQCTDLNLPDSILTGDADKDQENQ